MAELIEFGFKQNHIDLKTVDNQIHHIKELTLIKQFTYVIPLSSH